MHAIGGLILFTILLVLLAFHSAVSDWMSFPSVRYLPFVLYVLVFTLGILFAQNRASFIAVLLWIIVALTDHACFVLPDAARGQATVFLSSLYVAWFCALFYRFDERGVFTATGVMRGLLILSALLVILLLPAIPDISCRLAAPSAGLLRPVGGVVRVPRVAVLSFMVSLPFLLWRKPHESPVMGLMYALTVLFVLTGLCFAVSAGSRGQARAGLTIFMSGAGVLLIWSVLESSWRNANIDELTDLPGRRRLKHHLARLGDDYALAIADIDHFKKINDRYGHDVGDQVLRWIAAVLNRHEAGKAYRFGGEEFVIVCEDGTPKEIKADLDDLRETISAKAFLLRGPDRPRKKPASAPTRSNREAVTVTISIGFARCSAKHPTVHDVQEAADKQLYRAKKRGRNQVCG